MTVVNRITPTINPSKDETSADYSIKSDKGKYRPTLCHQIVIEAISRVREHGASRYGGTETWKRVEEQRYKDALYRHWLAYLENPDGIDAESGLPHLYHVACNVDFLLELQRERISGNCDASKEHRGHGEWIWDDSLTEWRCSVCNCCVSPWGNTPHCPKCGAKMGL